MGHVFLADEDEAAVAREVFGPLVTTVVFYDPEDLGQDPWYAVGLNGKDEKIGERWGNDASLPVRDGFGLFHIPGGRGQTVKFWLEVPPIETEDEEFPMDEQTRKDLSAVFADAWAYRRGEYYDDEIPPEDQEQMDKIEDLAARLGVEYH